MEAKTKLGEGDRNSIKELLLDHALYKQFEDEHKSRLEDIGRKNREDINSPICFIYKTQQYNVYPTRKGQWVRPVQLRKEFWDEMDKVLRDYKIVTDTEKPYVVGYVISMLNASNSILDYIELSPNVLLPMFKLLLQHNISFPRELSDQEVAEFKITHKNSLDKVNYRALLNVVAY